MAELLEGYISLLDDVVVIRSRKVEGGGLRWKHLRRQSGPPGPAPVNDIPVTAPGAVRGARARVPGTAADQL